MSVTLNTNTLNVKDPNTGEYVNVAVYGASGEVADWLDNHPEATTTVQDKSITPAKFADSTVSYIEQVTDRHTAEEIASSVETETAKQVAQMQVKEGQTVIDATLTVTGAAADAKATGDAVKTSSVFYNLLEQVSPVEDRLHNGISYTWDGLNCTITGTATGDSFCNILVDRNELTLLKADSTYYIEFSGNSLSLNVYYYASINLEDNISTDAFKNNGIIHIPANTKSIIVRLFVPSGTTVNESVSCKILTYPSTEEVLEEVYNTQASIDKKVSLSNQSGSVNGSGNPLVLNGTESAPFRALTTVPSTFSSLRIYGKNLFEFNATTTRTVNNITFTFDPTNGSIRVQSSGATAASNSASVQVTVNGQTTMENFVFKAIQKCSVTISANRSIKMTHLGDNTYCFMQILRPFNNSNLRFALKEDSYTVDLNAGEEIGIRFFANIGWAGDVTYYPQVEVNTHPTAFEVCKRTTVTPTEESNTNVFQLFNCAEGRYYYVSNRSLTYYCYPKEKKIRLQSSTTTAADIIGNLATEENFKYICDFSFTVDTNCYISGVPTNAGLRGQVFYVDNGTKKVVMNDNGSGAYVTLKANIVYYYCLYVSKGVSFDCLDIYPIIATGMYGILSRNGTTVIISDDDVVISAEAEKKSISGSALDATEKLNGLNVLIADRFKEALKRYKRITKPMISFIDDDTSNTELVRRYYDALHAAEAVGNYAVISNSMLTHEGELDLLLDYEKKGFGCLLHCNKQGGNSPTSPGAVYLPQYRDLEKAEDDFVTCLRAMEEAGFSAYNYWVIPYGADDDDIIMLARRHKMECAFTMGQRGFLTPVNCDRWLIPRFHISPQEIAENGLEQFKLICNDCVKAYGWLVIVTHTNEWDATTTMDNALTEAANYAKNLGMDIRNVPDAYEIFKPFFYMNELF